MTATRRLAAILAADVVGYSRLMGEDEAGTARAVCEHRQAATDPMPPFGHRLAATFPRRNRYSIQLGRHCEERSDEAIQGPKGGGGRPWIASLRSQ
jgi:hypothetical protein